ncbi:TlpA family protein disulfide reductase [Pinibacter soli]|uniref:TlpA disulfide reductase family protein n=1 Tax=Pinibacter soli TaxID=3044211 RepID=A0ABT6RHP6_9BACT|nr:TlpA disulfide reductase family protein [Pinibacter soli]MDI3321374.1 TlpA disulfide reductase family protein [Pinibacter soli]
MNKLFFCLCLMVLVSPSYAQKTTKNGLQIGDTVPNVFFGETLQGDLPVKSMTDLKGKLTILDFWTTGCVGCILGMPALDSLQSTFGNKIQTIIVCKNERQEVEKVFKRIKKPFPKTPIVLADSILNACFPHRTVPHHVWIDGNGVVKFITYDHNATVENVRKFLQGEHLHFSVRKQIPDFNDKVMLYNEGGGRWNQEIKFHTLFATFLDGVEHAMPQMIYDPVSNTQTLRVVNYQYSYLFGVAYNESFGDGLYNQPARWLLETKDSVDFFQKEVETDSLIDDWNKKYMASYEAVIPGNHQKQLFKTMQRDLNAYSPYVAQVEKRKVKCLVLVNKGIRPTTYKGKDSVFVEEADKSCVVRNYTIRNSVLAALTTHNYFLRIPILDETNFTKKTDVHFSNSLDNLSDPTQLKRVQEELRVNGLGLEYGYRTLDMLVVRDKHE